MFWLLWQPYGHVPTESARPQRHVEPSPSDTPDHSEDHLTEDDVGERLLAAFGDQILCVLSGNGTCLGLSEGWETLTGHAMDEGLGEAFLSHIHENFRDKLRHRLGARLEADAPGTKLRCQLRHRDGSWHWYDLCIASVQQERDSRQFTCLMRHVNSAVHMERQLQRARLEAQVALKGRSDFLANMSHELRTPLNAIIGFSQIMENQMFGPVGNPRYIDYLANIQESGYSLLNKINDLLEISHIDSGRVSLKEEEIDLTSLVRSAIEIHSHHAFSARIALQEQLLDRPVTLVADRVKLKQAVSNILSNALHYNKAGGTVLVETKLAGDGSALITVTDDGQGISPKQLKEIHAALQQEDSFFERELNGTGLGLALAKEYVALHQGKMALESQSGQGCKVTITLPPTRTASAPRREMPATKSKKRSATG